MLWPSRLPSSSQLRWPTRYVALSMSLIKLVLNLQACRPAALPSCPAPKSPVLPFDPVIPILPYDLPSCLSGFSAFWQLLHMPCTGSKLKDPQWACCHCCSCIITHRVLIPTTESARKPKNPKPYNLINSPNKNRTVNFLRVFRNPTARNPMNYNVRAIVAFGCQWQCVREVSFMLQVRLVQPGLWKTIFSYALGPAEDALCVKAMQLKNAKGACLLPLVTLAVRRCLLLSAAAPYCLLLYCVVSHAKVGCNFLMIMSC